MGRNVFQKICDSHGLDMTQHELPIIPDQVLTQDATATPVFLQLEAMGLKKVKPMTVSYIDHNTLQVDHKNPDDHIYLIDIAKKLGVNISKAGNGICHQVHLERFAVPGEILIGADSHTPTAGGLGMLAIGAGGLDVAVAMTGEPYYLPTPKVVGVKLTDKLKPWCTAKDIILHILSMVTVKGGRGKVFEYFGDGVTGLSIYDRATICNMGAEMGATSSIFPSDHVARKHLKAFKREEFWNEIIADDDAIYDEIIRVDLAKIEPLIALPHSPDNVRKVKDVEGVSIQQVAIGSCTNSSYKDMLVTAEILKNKKIPESISLIISPGSNKVLSMMCETGVLKDLLNSGARVLEATCGPCNGVGQAPPSGSNSLRTYNRNYKGRCGTMDAMVYLASPETAAASALQGRITDPRSLGEYPKANIPDLFPENDNFFILSSDATEKTNIKKGPNIKPIPVGNSFINNPAYTVAFKAGDDVTTDDILPGGASMLALRSNVPDSVQYLFTRLDASFKERVSELPDSWMLIGGENFGQGSSREHAVMVPLYAGMKAIIAKSFARIYRKNLINYGILPIVFKDKADYEKIAQNDQISISNLEKQLKTSRITVFNKTKDIYIETECKLSEREYTILVNGGLLNFIKNKLTK